MTGKPTELVIAELAAKLEDCRADRERMRGALEHIANVCKGSRQSTRRIRWLEARARSAIADDDDWSTVDLPKHDPLVERLNSMIVSIYMIVIEEIAARREGYEYPKGVIEDDHIRRELEILERFRADAIHNIEFIREMEKSINEQRRPAGTRLDS